MYVMHALFIHSLSNIQAPPIWLTFLEEMFGLMSYLTYLYSVDL